MSSNFYRIFSILGVQLCTSSSLYIIGTTMKVGSFRLTPFLNYKVEISLFSWTKLTVTRTTHGFSPIRSMQLVTDIGMAHASIRNSRPSTTLKSSNGATVKLMFPSHNPTLHEISLAMLLVFKVHELTIFNFS